MPVSPPKHRPNSWRPPAERSLAFERERGSSTARGYDRNWQKLRKVILARDPLCVFCLPDRFTPSHQVDHIIPIAQRPDLRLDPTNLRGLCDTCHSRHTASQQGKAR